MSGVVFALGVIFVMAAMAGLFKPELFKDKKTGEVPNRWQVFFGGVMVAAVAFLIAHYSAPEPKAETASSDVKADSAVTQGPIYSSGSPDALVAATRLMTALDKTMLASPSVILNGDVQALGAHSRLFGDLVASAKEQFGATVYDRLGSCGIASGNARSWWQAQIAAQKDGSEPVPGAIKEFLDQYQKNRKDCLEAAGYETNG
ncbi:CHAP domain-containing protein [Pseudomonas putida]|uniref:CHAP domain-containing protein n=1 Tax=Pseudomonas putida TaxID=303 RepID=UPI001F9EE016|nr:Uncharacterised protein [Pseudomonas putida]CAB5541625.1 Uncharacterised protein [Pseudomonas putida]CAB5543013.1 Uncharacterised protein [Pseudomonas putida]CAB5638203.1 Uncharacterised protein [Pseudomonas putida]CAB5653603.1 Uncharacterised protein [Pseudomonas putida]